MISQWIVKSQRIIFGTKPFNILSKDYYNPTRDQNFTAFVIDAPRWANVIGLTEKNEILLIRQYRFGTDHVELEIPGGVLEADEEPLIGIQRELEEETGFVSDDWKLIGRVDANPAIQNNICYTFLAKNIRPFGQINFDPTEEIEYELVPIQKVRELIGEGKITNTFIIAAFYWFEREMNQIEKDNN
ncbi:NUDIX hydrolase [Candidatus Harpocratesius sp.]